eukprot:TRINITY_DN8711_c0_g1_i1.p1 TRINITY_DN8711_c0_g1~~TRINITY_DN8711_c0_g1_i1.p1  ORF type:complete len:518 (+),score=109.50 TRINITY_DN8711_c0_g1_i1:206-1555(+)
MREALTNPRYGYYMNRDVFGTKGDFITSPEISQMFGELIGVWCVAMWQKMGSPTSFRLVELGPGRGTLMKDIVRAAKRFPRFYSSMSVHFVEISPHMRVTQARQFGLSYPEIKLEEVLRENLKSELEMLKEAQKGSKKNNKDTESDIPVVTESSYYDSNWEDTTSIPIKRRTEVSREEIDPSKTEKANPLDDIELTSDDGIKFQWHIRISDVPPGPTLLIAHEFFDALPVHQFQYTENGWRERLIDADNSDSPNHLQFVVSKKLTFAANTLLRGKQVDHLEKPNVGDTLEISPACMAAAQDIGLRIEKEGGAALVIDYGHNYPQKFSLQAIKMHKFVDIFEEPGTADLSCMVDFSSLAKAAKTKIEDNEAIPNTGVETYGPITQKELLNNLGLETRLMMLLFKMKEESDAENLISSFNRLINDDQMGTIYKAMTMCNTKLNGAVGFTDS